MVQMYGSATPYSCSPENHNLVSIIKTQDFTDILVAKVSPVIICTPDCAHTDHGVMHLLYGVVLSDSVLKINYKDIWHEKCISGSDFGFIINSN